MSDLDLLALLHNIGFSIKESDSHIWYAKKTTKLGYTIVLGCNDIKNLYRLCIANFEDIIL